jgi:ubiquinone/menaquinone biosynthesis C-methylase UbiE
MRDSLPQARSRRERDEAARSAIEAARTPDAALRTEAQNIARYLNASSATAYPLEYAHALVGDAAGKRVLDFGCGSGENSLLLAHRGARVVGVDISHELLVVARRRLALNGISRTVAFAVGSAHALPLRDDSVDVVLGIAVLHHLELDAAAAEISRVLVPGGVAIFQEPVRDSALVRGLRRLIPLHAADVSPHERPLTAAEVERFSRHFVNAHARAFWLPFVNLIHATPVLYSLVHIAHAVDAALLRRFPALERFAGIRVIRVEKADGIGCAPPAGHG